MSTIHMIWLPCLASPYIIGKIREIDKGIPVFLLTVDTIVAVTLLLAYRIICRPAKKKLFSPRLKLKRTRREHPLHILSPACTSPVYVIIHHKHIHVCSGEISLVVIMRLKTVAASSTLTGLRRTHIDNSVCPGTFGKFRKRIIAFTAVAILIRRIQMDNILICVILCSAPPGICHGMLNIHPRVSG